MLFDSSQRSLPGTVALLGSGEYLPVMNEIDTYLLQTIGGAPAARVALLPTASGLELMGRQTVSIFANDGMQKVLKSGEEILLHA